MLCYIILYYIASYIILSKGYSDYDVVYYIVLYYIIVYASLPTRPTRRGDFASWQADFGATEERAYDGRA